MSSLLLLIDAQTKAQIFCWCFRDVERRRRICVSKMQGECPAVLLIYISTAKHWTAFHVAQNIHIHTIFDHHIRLGCFQKSFVLFWGGLFPRVFFNAPQHPRGKTKQRHFSCSNSCLSPADRGKLGTWAIGRNRGVQVNRGLRGNRGQPGQGTKQHLKWISSGIK